MTRYLSRTPEPLLTTPKNGRFLEVMGGEFFEGLMDTSLIVLHSGGNAATLKIHFPLIVLLPRVLLDLHHVAITGVACWANTIDRYGHWRWLV